MASDRAEESEMRNALHMAFRALLHARKWSDQLPPESARLVIEAQEEVGRVLDIGRDEANEMVLS